MMSASTMGGRGSARSAGSEQDQDEGGRAASHQEYFDVSTTAAFRQNMVESKMPFPWKVQVMLEDVERRGRNDVISWLPSGKSFRIHKQDEFVRDILPKYFKQSKITSFTRQLYIYQFQKLQEGDDKGAFSHPQFLKGDKSGALQMKRTQEKARRRKQENKEQSSSNSRSAPARQQKASKSTKKRALKQDSQQLGGRDDAAPASPVHAFFNWDPEQRVNNPPSSSDLLGSDIFSMPYQQSMIHAAPVASRHATPPNEDNASILPTHQFQNKMLNDCIQPSRRSTVDMFQNIGKLPAVMKNQHKREKQEKDHDSSTKKPKLERYESLNKMEEAPADTLELDDDFDYEKLPGFFDNPL
jgi:hypothetical protein